MADGSSIGPGNNSISLVRNLQRASKAVSRSMNALSAGKQTESKTNPVAMAIATQMSARILSMGAAQQNVSMAHSTLSIVDGAQQQTSDLMSRARELAVQASNDTLAADDRAAIQQELNQVVEQIDTIAQNTEFNGQSLMNQDQTLTMQTGVDAGNTMAIDLKSTNASDLGLQSVSVASATDAQNAITALDTAIAKLGSMRADVGASQNRLDAVAEINSVAEENSRAARSGLIDTDFARETAELAKNQIRKNAALAIQAQAHQNAKFTLPLLGVVKTTN